MGKQSIQPGQRVIRNAPAGFLYQHIADDLCRRIENTEWGIGDKLPGRRALAEEYGVDQNTIHPAIARLISLGLLHAFDRKGTFVARMPSAADYSTASSFPTLPLPIVPSPNGALSVRPSNGIKPVVGILLMGGYQADDTASDSDHWGNIVALLIERSISSAGGCTYVEDASSTAITPILEAFRQKNVNVLIVVDNYGLLDNRDSSLVPDLETCGFPVVIVGADEMITSLPLITYDQQYAGFLAAQHLIQCGYRDIMFFRPFHAHWADERMQGAQRAMLRNHLPPGAFTVFPASPIYDELAYYEAYYGVESYYNPYFEPAQGIFDDQPFGQDLLTYLQANSHRAIIAPNDVAACMLMQFTQAHGLTCGIDYGLIGFDDTRKARKVGLTSVRAPMDAMGELAARLAVSLLQREVSQYRIAARSHVIERASTQRSSFDTSR